MIMIGLGGFGGEVCREAAAMLRRDAAGVTGAVSVLCIDVTFGRLCAQADGEPVWPPVPVTTIQGEAERDTAMPEVTDVLDTLDDLLLIREHTRWQFEAAVEKGLLEPLSVMLDGAMDGAEERPVEILIVSSICGGTGSALILPVTRWIRNRMAKGQETPIRIRSMLMTQDLFTGHSTSVFERKLLHRYTQETVKELSGIDDQTATETSELLPNAGTPIFDFICIFQRQNLQGRILRSLDAYRSYIADVLRTWLALMRKTELRDLERQILREVPGGQPVFMGVGAAHLLYPREDLTRYISAEAFIWELDRNVSIVEGWFDRCEELEIGGYRILTLRLRQLRNAYKEEIAVLERQHLPQPGTAVLYVLGEKARMREVLESLEGSFPADGSLLDELLEASVVSGIPDVDTLHQFWEEIIRIRLLEIIPQDLISAMTIEENLWQQGNRFELGGLRHSLQAVERNSEPFLDVPLGRLHHRFSALLFHPTEGNALPDGWLECLAPKTVEVPDSQIANTELRLFHAIYLIGAQFEDFLETV